MSAMLEIEGFELYVARTKLQCDCIHMCVCVKLDFTVDR